MLGPLRRFLRRRAGGDPDAELRFWLEQWEPHIRSGSLFSPGGLELTGDTEVADTYEGRRWQEARARARRARDRPRSRRAAGGVRSDRGAGGGAACGPDARRGAAPPWRRCLPDLRRRGASAPARLG